jgi:hypothetical protein
MTMTQLRTAWRRAVSAVAVADVSDPKLADVLAAIGHEAEASLWTGDEIDASGPLGNDLRSESDPGPVNGTRLAELAAGVTRMNAGVLEATRPDADRPWLALQVADGGHFMVATRSRAQLDELRRRFGEKAA